MKNQNLKPYSHRLFPEHMEELAVRAEERGLTTGGFLREIIQRELRKQTHSKKNIYKK
jgi:predicted DNA-binding protein